MTSPHLDPPPEPLPPPTGRPDRRALLQAYQDVVRTSRTRPAPRRLVVPDRTPFWLGSAAVIIGLVALLVFQPAWLFNRPPSESPQMQEASLRIRMFVEIERVQHFRETQGRWPATLIEAGGDSTGLSYQHLGEGFILTGVNGDLQLRFQSGESAEAFLGNSYQAVRGRAEGKP